MTRLPPFLAAAARRVLPFYLRALFWSFFCCYVPAALWEVRVFEYSVVAFLALLAMGAVALTSSVVRERRRLAEDAVREVMES